jgi:hypothetical protein
MSAADLVWVDDTHDREAASDGVSRYGAYLRDRAHLFDDDGAPLDTVSFAVLAWRTASSPVMAPGYVNLRRDVTAVTCRPGEEPGLLVADVEVRLPWPPDLPWGPMTGWQSWQRTRSWSGDEPDSYADPRREDRPALLVTAHLRVPVRDDQLQAPRRSRPGRPDTGDAKRVVRTLCRLVNAEAGPRVALLRGDRP